MSRICPITGKKPMSGNNRSHSSARAYRTLNKSLKEN